jgi:hypothetical protein
MELQPSWDPDLSHEPWSKIRVIHCWIQRRLTGQECGWVVTIWIQMSKWSPFSYQWRGIRTNISKSDSDCGRVILPTFRTLNTKTLSALVEIIYFRYSHSPAVAVGFRNWHSTCLLMMQAEQAQSAQTQWYIRRQVTQGCGTSSIWISTVGLVGGVPRSRFRWGLALYNFTSSQVTPSWSYLCYQLYLRSRQVFYIQFKCSVPKPFQG